MLFVILFHPVNAIQITEIMYAPFQGPEWIEIYNDENRSINLSKWQFIDEKSIDEITCCEDGCSTILHKNSYVVLTGKSRILPHFREHTLCVDDKSLGNGLSNEGETIYLNSSNNTIHISYRKSLGAYRNNQTLETREDGTLAESRYPTPGGQNSIWNLSTQYADLIITEIMSNPFGKDNARRPHGEWVELFNPSSKAIDLKELEFTDSVIKNELYITHTNTNSTIIQPNSYAVVYRNKDTDFNLNNDHDEVRLYFQSQLLDSLSYGTTTEGMSWALYNNEWVETKPTPGEKNVFVEECDWSLKIQTNTSLTNTKLPFELKLQRHVGYPTNISVSGKIEDFYGNVIKTYTPWKNKPITTSSTKKYSPSLKKGTYQLSFEIHNLSCSDSNVHNNKPTKIIALNKEYRHNNSSLQITKINQGSDQKTKWGDIIYITVDLYKGKSTKKSVQIFAKRGNKKVSKVARLSVDEMYQSNTFIVPLQLLPNCDNKINDGSVQLYVVGLGGNDTRSLNIHGVNSKICKNYTSSLKRMNRSFQKQLRDLKKEYEKEKNYFFHRIEEIPGSLKQGTNLPLSLIIQNDDEFRDITLWAYLYRGSKCYSCNNLPRDQNRISFSITPGSLSTKKVTIIPDNDIEPGKYKIKVKLRKDTQKTTRDITKDISILPRYEKRNSSQILPIAAKSNSLIESPQKNVRPAQLSSSFVVYESTGDKAQHLTIYFLAISLSLIVVTLFRKP